MLRPGLLLNGILFTLQFTISAEHSLKWACMKHLRDELIACATVNRVVHLGVYRTVTPHCATKVPRYWSVQTQTEFTVGVCVGSELYVEDGQSTDSCRKGRSDPQQQEKCTRPRSAIGGSLSEFSSSPQDNARTRIHSAVL
jgi:hypothetical protein